MIDERCLLCSGGHNFRECPMTADPQTYLNAFAPKADTPPLEEPTSSSLPPTLFEEMFGRGAEPMLQDVADGDPELWTPEQRELALRIISGDKNSRDLTTEERSTFDGIAKQLSWAEKPGRPAQEIAPRIERAFEPAPQLQMPALDRPPAHSADVPVIEDEWPIKLK